MGKLIVIEGLDGCGKSTQTELLPQSLNDKAKSNNKKLKNYKIKNNCIYQTKF